MKRLEQLMDHHLYRGSYGGRVGTLMSSFATMGRVELIAIN